MSADSPRAALHRSTLLTDLHDARDQPPAAGARPKILALDCGTGRPREVIDAFTLDRFDVTYAEWPSGLYGAQDRYHAILLHVPPFSSSLAQVVRVARLSTVLPLVVCSAAGDERQVIAALEAGADDYLVLPLGAAELAARTTALVRRAAPGRGSVDTLRAGEFEVRLDEQRAYRNGRALSLSPLEFRLLATLVREAGSVVGHAMLLARVWGPQYVDQREYLRLYVTYLRARIEDNPRRPKFIVNERGLGYRFQAAEDPEPTAV